MVDQYRPDRPLSAMGYLGGKAGTSSSSQTGPWINSKIPWNKDDTYLEPFAGMLGVLLQRKRCMSEIINDLDSRVINWWRVVRDQPEEFARAIRLTPYSREEYKWAKEVVDTEESSLKRALAFTVLTHPVLNGWGITINGHKRDWRNDLHNRIHLLEKRLSRVQLENKDACELIERVVDEPSVVMYVDPPYKDTTGTKGGYRYDVNRERLTALLEAMKGKVAISGYGEEWEHLGWHRHEYDTVSKRDPSTVSKRTEVLWCNYDDYGQERLL